jgi:hypothetical protein
MKLNVPILHHAAGALVRSPCDDTGLIHNKFWRRRLQDSKIDSCLEVLRKKPKKGVVNA